MKNRVCLRGFSDSLRSPEPSSENSYHWRIRIFSLCDFVEGEKAYSTRQQARKSKHVYEGLGFLCSDPVRVPVKQEFFEDKLPWKIAG